MKLDDYLSREKISQADFGLKLEPSVTQGQVSHWINGRSRISVETAKQIETLTGGEVTVYDWPDRI